MSTLDPQLVDGVEKVVRETAIMICAEQPDVPEPSSLNDLDSFSLVQVLLELENVLEIQLLEKLEPFDGDTFRDLAEFIVGLADDETDEPTESATAGPAAAAEPTASSPTAVATQEDATPAA
ncbi:hypothetical protein QLQ12_42050 [Actinoplanes sp. NEAU-A12]|uniref:Carrier domain-containing protein n=1 Tax=Actinoplanes sandaracinus TaxID=3045177 RepID=A0ABT6WZP2_9ACTN|nr:hypothetical protein [Actinoplanes sandaracinus]MDI6105189.1 hypothetical protein [Actinoplanes sandaracinus]